MSTKLHEAAANGMIDVIKSILEAGGKVDLRDNDGATPLLFVAYGGRTEAARFLVEKGADVLPTSATEYSPVLPTLTPARTLSTRITSSSIPIYDTTATATPSATRATPATASKNTLLLSLFFSLLLSLFFSFFYSIRFWNFTFGDFALISPGGY